MDKCKYSVVIPIYNEFNSILPLYNNLSYEMNKLQDSYEIIFVNDGSVPMEGMCHLKNSMDKNISKIVDLPKRMGQTKALAVGFKESRGDIIISMDGDLQDNPKYIPNFIEKFYQGFDVVCGYRIKRNSGKMTIILSRTGNFLQRMLFHTKLHDISCTYRIYKKDCIKNLRLIRKGYHRYIPLLLIAKGFKLTEIPIKQGKRLYGHSKYSVFFKVPRIVTNLLLLLFDIATNKT